MIGRKVDFENTIIRLTSNLGSDILAHASASDDNKKPEPQSTINDDIQEAYRAFSNSPWGTWLGGQVGKVVKQVCRPSTVLPTR